jgi:hypothetical protein
MDMPKKFSYKVCGGDTLSSFGGEGKGEEAVCFEISLSPYYGQ